MIPEDELPEEPGEDLPREPAPDVPDDMSFRAPEEPPGTVLGPSPVEEPPFPPGSPAAKQAQSRANRAAKKTTIRSRITAREAQERTDRRGRLGKEEPPNLDDARMVGAKDQERDDVRSLDDLSKLIDQYQNNLNRLLGRMQNTLIEAILHIETLENHWQRLK